MPGKFAVVALLAVFSGFAFSQNAAPAQTAEPAKAPAVAIEKRNLTPEDYKMWELPGSPVISNDGKFLAVTVRRVDADGYLFIRKIDGPEKVSVPFAGRPTFSDSGKFIAYSIGVSKDEAEKNAEARRPNPTKMAIRNLETGAETIYDDVSRFQFLKGSEIIVALRPNAEPKSQAGSDLLILNPNGGEPMVIANVSSYETNEKQDLIAVVLSTSSGYNALEIVNPFSGTVKSAYYGKSEIATMAWAKNANTLVAAVAVKDEKKDGNNHKLWRFANVGTSEMSKQELDPATFEGFPKGSRINEGSGLSLSEDGTSVLFGVRPWKDVEKPKNPKKTAGVEVWNSKDKRPIPQQKVELGRDLNRGSLYTWSPAKNKLVPIFKDGIMPDDTMSASVSRDHKYAVIVDGSAYQSSSTNGIDFSDFSVLNIASGERTSIAAKNLFFAIPSETGRFVAYYEDRKWWSFDCETKKVVALRPEGKFNFEDELDDKTVEVKPPAQSPIWLKDDAGVILHDQFDAYLAAPKSGKLVRLTQGREENLRFRFINTAADKLEPELTGNLYFSVLDVDTKKAGVYISDGKGSGKVTLYDDVVISDLRQAKNADRMMFVMESSLKSPDVYITNLAFSAAKPVTKFNSQQANFNWGKTEVVRYKSRFGVELQGTLLYPAGFDPKKKYPMVTYIYERLSDEKNQYRYPFENDAYNEQVLSQSGYFVFMPDIAYTGNRPGESALNCLEPAVDAAVKQEKTIDAKKVGLIGHSWGAYQTAFVTTVSDRFAAGACGAPLTELTSMYNSFYWNAGITDQVLMESSQGRMRVPFWEDPKAYIDNSPVWQASKRKNPIMFAFGDADGAVDWHQGQYLYNTLRRMGKPCVMLVYAGENHNFRNRPNQLDYAKRMRHWLGVYLKGEKPEKWITNSIPFSEQIGK